jgi:hypothetical protein
VVWSRCSSVGDPEIEIALQSDSAAHARHSGDVSAWVAFIVVVPCRDMSPAET